MSSSMVLEHDWFPKILPSNVVIGQNSWIYSSFSFLHFRSQRKVAVRIGKSCGIYNGCFFELGPEGSVEVGDFTALVGVIFSTNGSVSIGSYCILAHEVVIADCHVMTPPDSRITAERNRTENSSNISIGNNVWVGTGVTILSGAKIGDGAVIGAGAVIDFEVPAMTIVAGNPAGIVGSVPR
jgi:acetyltransferase-like isoleucine patch superfamily enzyme